MKVEVAGRWRAPICSTDEIQAIQNRLARIVDIARSLGVEPVYVGSCYGVLCVRVGMFGLYTSLGGGSVYVHVPVEFLGWLLEHVLPDVDVAVSETPARRWVRLDGDWLFLVGWAVDMLTLYLYMYGGRE